MSRLRTVAACNESVLADAQRDLRLHKLAGKNPAAVAHNRARGLKAPILEEQPSHEWEQNYTLDNHLTPEGKARADAEWGVSDEFGRLPDGWTYSAAKGQKQ